MEVVVLMLQALHLTCYNQWWPQLNASVVSGGSGGGSASVGSGNTAGSLPISASNTLNSKWYLIRVLVEKFI